MPAFDLRPLVSLSLLGGWLLPAPADAACSRPIRVPVSAVGTSVILHGHEVSGAYPALLRRIGSSAGCQFLFTPMPRARVEQMFENGEADMLVPATRSDRRDQLGEFLPLVQSRVVAIGLKGPREPVRSLEELATRSKQRVVLVRGFDFGPSYRALVERLREQQRLVMEADPAGVARALQAGMAELTVMAPNILYGVIDQEPRLRELRERLRIEALDDMPWGEAGFYLSTRALPEADRQLLRGLVHQAQSSGLAWQLLTEHYPAGTLDGAMKPR